jgi:di/tricarboxylate transporter
MTLAQGLAFAIVTVMMALFAWGRWRYDLVAVVALLAAVVVGVVPPTKLSKASATTSSLSWVVHL